MRAAIDLLLFALLASCGGAFLWFFLDAAPASAESGEPYVVGDDGVRGERIDAAPEVVTDPTVEVPEGGWPIAPPPGGPRAKAEIPEVDGVLNLRWSDLASFRYIYPKGFMDATPEERAKLPSPIPDEVRAWDGKRAAIPGHLLAMESRDGWVTEFTLTRYFGTCCYGQSTGVADWVLCTSVPEEGFQIFPGEAVLCIGELEVGEVWLEGGFVDSIYRMKVDEVRVLDQSQYDVSR